MLENKHRAASGTPPAAGRGEAVVALQEIPNVGPKMAALLFALGISRLDAAAGRDAEEMYEEICALEASRLDPCARDVFAAVVSHADGHRARPWWEFTPRRKARGAERRAARAGRVEKESA